MKVYINYENKLKIELANDDRCTKCVLKEYCPLISALSKELIIPRYEKFTIEHCGHYLDKEVKDNLDTKKVKKDDRKELFNTLMFFLWFFTWVFMSLKVLR